jgi:hypothetical protein
MEPLSDMMNLDDLLPIELEDWTNSCSSLSLEPTSTTKPQQQQQQRRSVSFGGIQSLDFIESSRDMTDQDLEDRWFTRSELADFKLRARTLFKDEYNGKDVGEDESTRGMDIYYPSRQKSHAKYIYHVMHAFHVECKGNPEHVAMLCERWSTKARDRAIVAAAQDFYQAYFPHMAQPQTFGGVGKARPAPVQRQNKRLAPSELRAPARTRSL